MKIYLDSCTLIAYFSPHEEEKEKKKEINAALLILEQLKDVELCVSHWAISEFINILLSKHKLTNEEVLKLESSLLNKKRIGNIKLTLIEISGDDKKYDLQEFIYDIRENILKYHSGVGDVIHSVIMKNNRINYILTFDEKEDFKKIEGLVVLHPKNIKL